MNIVLTLVLALLAAAVAMYVVNRPRIAAVALIVIAVLPSTGVMTIEEALVTIEEALAGFSDPNEVLIVALFGSARAWCDRRAVLGPRADGRRAAGASPAAARMTGSLEAPR